MIFGVTGSRSGPSHAQLGWLRERLEERGTALHHGACVGVDAAAHGLAMQLGLPVMVHPPADLRHADLSTMLAMPDVTVLRRKPYLERNRDIVDACEVLLALPDGPEKQRGSGTWATIRYATKVGRPVWVCAPDGRKAV